MGPSKFRAVPVAWFLLRGARVVPIPSGMVFATQEARTVPGRSQLTVSECSHRGIKGISRRKNRAAATLMGYTRAISVPSETPRSSHFAVAELAPARIVPRAGKPRSRCIATVYGDGVATRHDSGDGRRSLGGAVSKSGRSRSTSEVRTSAPIPPSTPGLTLGPPA